MSRNTRFLTGILCGLLAGVIGLPVTRPTQFALAGDAPSESSITVHVRTGRTFTAEMDVRTDSTQLWLRWQRGSAEVLRPIRWDHVVKVHVLGEELSGDEFQGIVAAVRQDAPVQTKNADVSSRKRLIVTASADSPRSTSTAAPRPPRKDKRVQVRSLEVDAHVANWNGDVEVDGLTVYVYPLEVDGTVVPVRGTLEVNLMGQRFGVVKRPGPFVDLGRWTRQVHAEDFGPEGAVYRLPFRRIHPEFNAEVASHAAIHARLSVPGQGTFDATKSTVRIRPYSAVRDELQQATGRRFFPIERTGGIP